MTENFDKSKFKTVLSEEDLRKLAAVNLKWVDKGWYKFRSVAVTSGVSSAKMRPNPDGTSEFPKGRQTIVESFHALRADGNLSTAVKEVQTWHTLYAPVNPELLKLYGYSDEMIEGALKLGLPHPFVFDAMRHRLAAHYPWNENNLYAGYKNGNGEFSRTLDEVRKNTILGQDEFWANPDPLAGDEVYARVTTKENGKFTNVNLNYFKSLDNPPREKDGTLSIIIDPDAK